MDKLIVPDKLEKLVFVVDVSPVECEEVGHDRSLPQVVALNIKKLLVLCVRMRFKKIIEVECRSS